MGYEAKMMKVPSPLVSKTVTYKILKVNIDSAGDWSHLRMGVDYCAILLTVKMKDILYLRVPCLGM